MENKSPLSSCMLHQLSPSHSTCAHHQALSKSSSHLIQQHFIICPLSQDFLFKIHSVLSLQTVMRAFQWKKTVTELEPEQKGDAEYLEKGCSAKKIFMWVFPPPLFYRWSASVLKSWVIQPTWLEEILGSISSQPNKRQERYSQILNPATATALVHRHAIHLQKSIYPPRSSLINSEKRKGKLVISFFFCTYIITITFRQNLIKSIPLCTAIFVTQHFRNLKQKKERRGFLCQLNRRMPIQGNCRTGNLKIPASAEC